MSLPKVVSQEEWTAARRTTLEKEKDLKRDALLLGEMIDAAKPIVVLSEGISRGQDSGSATAGNCCGTSPCSARSPPKSPRPRCTATVDPVAPTGVPSESDRARLLADRPWHPPHDRLAPAPWVRRPSSNCPLPPRRRPEQLLIGAGGEAPFVAAIASAPSKIPFNEVQTTGADWTDRTARTAGQEAAQRTRRTVVKTLLIRRFWVRIPGAHS